MYLSKKVKVEFEGSLLYLKSFSSINLIFLLHQKPTFHDLTWFDLIWLDLVWFVESPP